MTTSNLSTDTDPDSDSAPASRLVAASPTLPLERAALRVTAQGGIARVVLEQHFANHHREPLAVTYVLPLPADAAVSGYSFSVGDRRIEGEVDRRAAARERYDDAIVRGQTAALLEQDRSSLFTQQIGNVPPGARVMCEIVLDQRLRWLEEGAWEWRFPLAAAPRYLGEADRVPDAGALAFPVAMALSPRAELALSIGDALAEGRAPESPSHGVRYTPGRHGLAVALDGGAELDRDLVVRWTVAGLAPALSVLAERDARGVHALLTLVPPLPEARLPAVRRDLIVLLDTSGSMGGSPLTQARRVASALIDGLGERDTFELIEFSSRPRRFAAEAMAATSANRKGALAWLAALTAGGGTEMRAGILEALRPVRDDAQRQVVVITDGLIGFEQEIVQAIAERLPAGSRVHTVGVGSSVNRSLTGPAARAGLGVEIILGLGEDPERAVQRLRARTEVPLVVDVTVEGSAVTAVAPAKIPDLFAGCPVLVSARLRERGELIVRGRGATGLWEQRVVVEPRDVPGSVTAALFGREAVEDCDVQLAAGGDREVLDRAVERLGLEYQIATRMTSWVAVDKAPSVDPTLPTRREVVPQALPHGMSVDGLGLRGAGQGIAPLQRFGGTNAQPIALPPRIRIAERPGGVGGGRSDSTRHRFAMRAPLRRPSGSDEKKPKKRPEPLVKGAFTGASRPVVRASIIHRKGREITIEFQCSGEMLWEPQTFDVVLTRDGDLTGTVDFQRTTGGGWLAAGQVGRITIILDADTKARITQIVFKDQAFLLK